MTVCFENVLLVSDK